MRASVYKKSLSAASLVVAIPGAFLGYLLVMAFLESPGFDNMAGFFKIISGLSLALVTLMVLMPVVILIFGPKAEPAEKKDQAEPAEALDEEDEDLSVGDEGDFADDQADDVFAEDDADAFDDDEFGEDDFGDDDAFDDFDDFDDDKRK